MRFKKKNQRRGSFLVRVKSVLPNAAALPPSGKTGNARVAGDAYAMEDTGHLWIWWGGQWTDTGPTVAAQLKCFRRRIKAVEEDDEMPQGPATVN
jgi:hypothetical protein